MTRPVAERTAEADRGGQLLIDLHRLAFREFVTELRDLVALPAATA